MKKQEVRQDFGSGRGESAQERLEINFQLLLSLLNEAFGIFSDDLLGRQQMFIDLLLHSELKSTTFNQLYQSLAVNYERMSYLHI